PIVEEYTNSGRARSLPLPVLTSARGFGRRLKCFELKFDHYLVRHIKASGRQLMTPGDAKVAPINLCLRRDPDARIATRAFDCSRQRKRQRHRFSNSLNCQVAIEHVTLALAFYFRALESHFRKLLNIEEICRAQMPVTILNSGVDAGDLGIELHRRLSDVLIVKVDCADEVFKSATNQRKFVVLNREPDDAVRHIHSIFAGGYWQIANRFRCSRRLGALGPDRTQRRSRADDHKQRETTKDQN